MKRCKHDRSAWCEYPDCLTCAHLARIGQRKMEEWLKP